MPESEPTERGGAFTPEIGDEQFRLAIAGMPMVVIPLAAALASAKGEPLQAARAVHMSRCGLARGWCC